VRSPTLSGLFRLLFVAGLSLSVPTARAQESVRQIEIHVGWGGLGTPRNIDVIIHSKDGTFVRDGERVDAAQVHALVSALQAPRIPKPDMDGWPVLAKQGWVRRWFQEFCSLCVSRCLFANARPDPHFKYLSNSSARCLSARATYAIRSQGLNLLV
jgi:hypothetical protein